VILDYVYSYSVDILINTMPERRCPYPDCNFTTIDVTDDLAAVMLKIHADGAHSSSKGKPAKVETVRRPTVSAAGTSEEWSCFLTRWEEYKTATKLSGSDVVIQLLECCEEDLRKDLTRAAGGTLTNKPEVEVIRQMKLLAVRQENVLVARIELYEMQQDVEESIRSYAARVKGQADVCKYIINCPNCKHDVNYTIEILKDIVVKGILDGQIRLDLLGNDNQEMSYSEVLRFVEAKESGKRSATKIL
jgi:hypothetical protein